MFIEEIPKENPFAQPAPGKAKEETVIIIQQQVIQQQEQFTFSDCLCLAFLAQLFCKFCCPCTIRFH